MFGIIRLLKRFNELSNSCPPSRNEKTAPTGAVLI